MALIKLDIGSMKMEIDRLTKENEALKAEVEYLKSPEGRSAEKLGACLKCITAVAKAEAERDRFLEDYQTALQDGFVTAGALEDVISDRDRLIEVFGHIHVCTDLSDDACKKCGLDIRNPIHMRTINHKEG